MSQAVCSFVPTAIEFGTVITQAPSTYFATAQITLTAPAVVIGTTTICDATVNPDTGSIVIDSCSAIVEELPPEKSVSDILIPMTTTVEYTLSTPSLTEYQTICPGSPTGATSLTDSPITLGTPRSNKGSTVNVDGLIALGVFLGVGGLLGGGY